MIAEMARSALAVLVAGLCFGAGLPALFTVGITLWSRATPDPGPDGTARRNPVALAGADRGPLDHPQELGALPRCCGQGRC